MQKSRLLLTTLSLASFSLFAQVSPQASFIDLNGFKANPIVVAGLKAENRIDGEYIVVFKANTPEYVVEQLSDKINTEYRALNRIGASGSKAFEAVKSLSTIKGFSGQLNKAQLAALKFNPNVKSIEANRVIGLASFDNPSMGKFSRSATVAGAWSVDRSDQASLPLDQTYAPALTGAGVHAYIIDSGIHTSHVDFGGRADWVFTASGVGGGNGDNNGHGTHIAGNVGSASYGIAKQVNLHAVKVLDGAGTGTLAGLIEGINYVTANHQKPAVATIGFNTSASQALNDAVAAAIAAGVTFTVPVGDESRDACNYSPSSVSEAISVASSWSDDRASVYSNKGSCVDLYAPGLYVKSLWHITDYANNTISHSPVSAAHVAGAAALSLEINGGCSPAEIKQHLIDHATEGALTQMPADTANRLLKVPTDINDYTSCVGTNPEPTPEPDPADFVTATASTYWNADRPEDAIDGLFGSNVYAWISHNTDTAPWLKLHYEVPTPVTHYRLSRGYCRAEAYFAGFWDVYGSNDDTNWTLLDTVADDQSALYPIATGCLGFGPSYELDNPGSYKFYRFNFTASPLSSTTGVGIGEIELTNN